MIDLPNRTHPESPPRGKQYRVVWAEPVLMMPARPATMRSAGPYSTLHAALEAVGRVDLRLTPHIVLEDIPK
jgi:hypothetical protein